MFTAPLPTPMTSFVGRTEELTSIAALLADPHCRLLTLCGAGGIGKTRLALQAAADQSLHYAHGVCFVPLAPLSSSDLLPGAVANALQLPLYAPKDIGAFVIRHLRDKHMLLILDSFEHLLAGGDLLTAILQAAPGVKLLVTSRERLNLQEEWVLTLEGLHVPDDKVPASLESYSAVQLFVQRARQTLPTFSLGENTDTVRMICQQVEGMPLGLELAACWLRAMSCQQIAAHIAGNLDFLASPLRNVSDRHRSLRRVFDQSWSLLSEDQRAVLMRLSVFRGGFDDEAAEQVAGASPLLLANLVDRSLIRMSKSGRYDLHELLRQYAAEKLEDAHATAATADDHLAYFMTLAERAEAHLWGREREAWFDRLEGELANLRTALTWGLQGKAAIEGLRTAGALGWFFHIRSRWAEGLSWLKQLLDAAPQAPVPLRAKALHRAAELAALLGDKQEASALTDEALALSTAAGDRQSIAWSLACLGYFVEDGEHPEQAAVHLDASLALFREIADPMGVNHVLRRRAHTALVLGDFLLVRTLYEEALLGAEAVGDVDAIAQVLLHMGDVYYYEDKNIEKAASTYQRSLANFQEAHDAIGVVWALLSWGYLEFLADNLIDAQSLVRECLARLKEIAFDSTWIEGILYTLACIAKASGALERAARLLGASENVVRDHPPPYSRFCFDEEVASLRTQLDDAAFAAAWAAGKGLSREQAIAYALEGRAAPTDMPQVTACPHTWQQSPRSPLIEPLTSRELEVLCLVADGLSNRAIADQLVLAVGTIKWYLNQINTKLGAASRTQAVARARELDLLA